MVWLALLNLAALRTPVAPSAYVTAPVLWLLPLAAAEISGRYALGIALAVARALIMGPPPLPDALDLVIGLISQGVVLALCLWLLLRTRPPATESRPAAVTPIPA